MMSHLASSSDPQYVAVQYQTAKNLNVRIALHQRFSTNKYGWHCWLFDQLIFPPSCRLLELGCGTGQLWLENIDRLPAGWEITLSDISAGMVHEARQNLGRLRHFRFEVIDAQAIPFESQSFEVVLANHMLYHLPDRDLALSEIGRVLKPGGSFYAATNGHQHVHEIADLLVRFDPQLAWWGAHPADSFTLENGAAQLVQWFTDVALRHYEDTLLVTDPAPLVDYILSGRMNLTVGQQLEFANFVRQEFQRFGGKFSITTDAGVFMSRRSLQS